MMHVNIIKSKPGGFHASNFYNYFLLTFSSNVYSKVSKYKDYEISTDELKLIKSKIKKAGDRPFPMKNYPIFFTISDSKNISLICPANMPTSDQLGCNLNFKYDNHVGRGIIITKDKSTSHLYCEPKGAEGSKVWSCTLSVQEFLSQDLINL